MRFSQILLRSTKKKARVYPFFTTSFLNLPPWTTSNNVISYTKHWTYTILQKNAMHYSKLPHNRHFDYPCTTPITSPTGHHIHNEYSRSCPMVSIRLQTTYYRCDWYVLLLFSLHPCLFFVPFWHNSASPCTVEEVFQTRRIMSPASNHGQDVLLYAHFVLTSSLFHPLHHRHLCSTSSVTFILTPSINRHPPRSNRW